VVGYIPEISDRSRAFDDIVAGAAEIVDSLPLLSAFHPEVRPAVTALGDIVSKLFLPNINEQGVAEVPDSKLETDGYGFVPLLHPDEIVQYGLSFYVCTPRRMQLTAAHYRIAPNRLRFMFLSFAYGWPRHPIPLDESDRQGGTTAVDAHLTDEGQTFHVVSRPLISLQPNTPPKGLIHELIHAYDYETEFLPPRLSDAKLLQVVVRHELRAYHVDHILAKHRQGMPGYDAIGDDFSAQVEAVRQRQPWPWRNGFRPHNSAIQSLIALGAIQLDKSTR